MRRRQLRVWVWLFGWLCAALIAGCGAVQPPSPAPGPLGAVNNPGLFISQSTCTDIVGPINGLTWCFDSVSGQPYVSNGSTWILPGLAANGTAFGNQSTGTQTCPNTAGVCSVTLTGSGVTLSAASPRVPTGSTQMLTWQETQDATGGRTFAWSSAFHFDSGTAPVPPLNPNQTEQYIFAWSPALSKWDFLSRGAQQQLPQTVQGNSDVIGFANGNVGNTNAPASVPANVWTQVCSDNGGFFAGQGGGVALYDYKFFCKVMLCNRNSSTEFFSTYCQDTGFFYRASTDMPIDGNQCVEMPFSLELSNVSGPNTFASFHCYVDPTNQLSVIHANEFTDEKPIQ